MGQANVYPQLEEKKDYTLVLFLVVSYWYRDDITTAIIAGRLVCRAVDEEITRINNLVFKGWPGKKQSVSSIIIPKGVDHTIQNHDTMTIQKRVALYKTCFVDIPKYSANTLMYIVVQKFIKLRSSELESIDDLNAYNSLRSIILDERNMAFNSRVYPVTKWTHELCSFISEEGLYDDVLCVLKGRDDIGLEPGYGELLFVALSCDFMSTIEELELLSDEKIYILMTWLNGVLDKTRLPVSSSESLLRSLFVDLEWNAIDYYHINPEGGYNRMGNHMSRYPYRFGFYLMFDQEACRKVSYEVYYEARDKANQVCLLLVFSQEDLLDKDQPIFLVSAEKGRSDDERVIEKVKRKLQTRYSAYLDGRDVRQMNIREVYKSVMW